MSYSRYDLFFGTYNMVGLIEFQQRLEGTYEKGKVIKNFRGPQKLVMQTGIEGYEHINRVMNKAANERFGINKYKR